MLVKGKWPQREQSDFNFEYNMYHQLYFKY